MKKQKSFHGAALLWLGTAALFAFAILPTLFRPMAVGHDANYHIMRLLNIAEEMRMGNPFPSVYSVALDGLGYGSPLFYSDLFFYPFAALTAMGMNASLTFKLMQIALLALIFFSMYLCARAVFGNKMQAHAAALAYAFSYYALSDVYFRTAVGECFGFAFLPVVYLGYHFITHGRADRWWILALGMAGIVLSHVLSVVIACMLLIALMISDAKLWLRRPGLLRYMICAALLCCGISCGFWLPMLEQMAGLSFRYSMDVSGVDRFLEGLCDMVTLLFPPELFPLFNRKPITAFGLAGAFGWAALLLCLVCAARKGLLSRLKNLAVCLFFVWMCSRSSLSRVLAGYLAVLQFPWRFMLPAALMFSVFIAQSFGAIASRRVQAVVLVLLLLSGAVASYTVYPSEMHALLDRLAAEENLSTREFVGQWLTTDHISGAQYLPIEMDPSDIQEPCSAVCSDESVHIELSRNGRNELHAAFSGNDSGAAVDLPLILYLGYAAETDDGERLPVSRGENGLVRVHLGSMESGEFTVRFAGTPLLHAGRWVSAASLLFFSGMMLCRKRRPSR
ncbi:MAG: glycosyltransferase family 39 protein [Clostridia bacterium]|nr:glycosyltransferase family 39 protein [Clostridia bacterium]